MSKAKKIKVENKLELQSEQLENTTDFNLQQRINISGFEEKIESVAEKEVAQLKMENERLKKILSKIFLVCGLKASDPGEISYLYTEKSNSNYINLKSGTKSVTIVNTLSGPEAGIKFFVDEVTNNFYFPHLKG